MNEEDELCDGCFDRIISIMTNAIGYSWIAELEPNRLTDNGEGVELSKQETIAAHKAAHRAADHLELATGVEITGLEDLPF